MTSPFMNAFSELMAERGVAVARFEFNYMAARRADGKRRPPPRAELLVPEYVRALEAARQHLGPAQRLFIGGKSMGGRVASLAAQDLHRAGRIDGVVCLGYPFHPPGKPAQLRTAHLADMTVPVLIVQGERDPFGSRSEVEALELPRSIALHWASDGDHDLGPRGASGYTRKGNLKAAADAVATFVLGEKAGGPGR